MILSSGLSSSRREPHHRMRVGPGLLTCLAALTACGGHHNPAIPDGSMQVVVSDGSLRVSTGFNDCPTGIVVSASPSVTRVGGRVAVAVRATDGDPSDHLAYAWTTTVGSFADATASNTIYTCPGSDQAGPATLIVAVSDGQCTEKRSVSVSCYVVTASSGGSDGGAQSDGGGTGGAGAAGGAAGAVGGQGGTTGAGGAGVACPGDLTTCEGTLCNQCTYGVAPGQTDLCSTTPESCVNCDPAVTGCNVSALASDADRTKCQALYVCVRDNNCMNPKSPGDAFWCWCGKDTDINGCEAGTVPAIGPCVQQFIAAAGSADPPTIYQRFIDSSYPVGAAMNLIVCRAQFCGKDVDPAHPSCPAW
jgi:hypothetical protein